MLSLVIATVYGGVVTMCVFIDMYIITASLHQGDLILNWAFAPSSGLILRFICYSTLAVWSFTLGHPNAMTFQYMSPSSPCILPLAQRCSIQDVCSGE